MIFLVTRISGNKSIFWPYIIDIKIVLIHYLGHEMVISVFVLLDFLLDNSKY